MDRQRHRRPALTCYPVTPTPTPYDHRQFSSRVNHSTRIASCDTGTYSIKLTTRRYCANFPPRSHASLDFDNTSTTDGFVVMSRLPAPAEKIRLRYWASRNVAVRCA